jgi:hypothetical protein
MPLPTPNKDEKESDFVSRCMGNKTMNDDYPDEKQRAAVCYSQWNKKETSKHPITPEMLSGREFLSGMQISSINAENRTVDIVFFTGVDIPRMDFWTGDKYTLRFDPAGADLSLLNNGAPVLDNHSVWDGSASQKGKVEKAWRDDGKWKATLRFSKRKSVDELWSDVEDRIVTKFSMGVELLETEKLREKDQEIKLAKKWRPFELSIAPIPADFGTTTLAAEERGSAAVQQRASAHMEEVNMPDKEKDTGTTETRADVSALSIIEEQKKAAQEAGALAELSRGLQILEISKVLNLSAEFAEKHIKEQTNLDTFRKLALDEQVRRITGGLGKELPNDTSRPVVRLISDEQDTRRELMGAAIFGMMNPKERKEDRHNPFLNLSIKQIAEESVRLQTRVRGPIPMQNVATMAMQTTADFASVLEVTSRKQLLAMYAYANPSYKAWTKRSTTPDFKTMTRVRLSETPEFLKVPEGAAITIGLMSDSKESYSLATYGRGISFTRQMLINDDLSAFNDLIGQFGVQAARLENKTVYSILNTNAAMADNIALFYGTHYNLGTGVLGNTAFDAAFGAMAIQKGIDGKSVLNLVPKHLIVPKAKESTARSVTMLVGPNVKAADQNWFANRLEVVADAELDGTSTTVWYLACDPSFAPGIEYCHLEGAEGPQFIRKDNEQGVLGIQFYGYLDFAAKAVDWRSLYKSSGA